MKVAVRKGGRRNLQDLVSIPDDRRVEVSRKEEYINALIHGDSMLLTVIAMSLAAGTESLAH